MKMHTSFLAFILICSCRQPARTGEDSKAQSLDNLGKSSAKLTYEAAPNDPLGKIVAETTRIDEVRLYF